MLLFRIISNEGASCCIQHSPHVKRCVQFPAVCRMIIIREPIVCFLQMPLRNIRNHCHTVLKRLRHHFTLRLKTIPIPIKRRAWILCRSESRTCRIARRVSGCCRTGRHDRRFSVFSETRKKPLQKPEKRDIMIMLHKIE